MLRAALQCLVQRHQLASSFAAGLTQQPIALSCERSASNLHRAFAVCIAQQQSAVGISSTLNQHLQHSSAAAYSTQLAVRKQQPLQQRPLVSKQLSKGKPHRQPFDPMRLPETVPKSWRPPLLWNKTSAKIPSRKPSIKKPSRHQWHYCDVNYDPMEPLPRQHLPPYAPLHAYKKNYKAVYHSQRPKHHRNHFKRMWTKNQIIREQRWKQAWERRIAAQNKRKAKIMRLAQRIIRRRAWEAYKADPAKFFEVKAQLEAKREERRQRQLEEQSEEVQQESGAGAVEWESQPGTA